MKKRCVKGDKFPEVEIILLQFFTQCRATNIPVSEPILMEKAKEKALEMNVSNFGFSTIG